MPILLFCLYVSTGEAVTYLYDDIGQLKKVVDENGNVATYNYDALGNLLSITRSTGGIQAPEIIDISPSTAAVGSSITVTINGNNFLGAAVTTNTPEITVSDVSASETTIKANFGISFMAPTGVVAVTVTTPFGSASTTLTLVPTPPTITSIIPNSGPPTRFVTIKGTAFSPVPSENIVSFNGTPAQVLYSDVFSIYTRVPEGATTGAVTVTTNSLLSNGFPFTVTTPTGSPPTITSITPNFGSVDGGTRIVVRGNGFILGTSISIGGNMTTDVSVQNANSLFATTPSGYEGFADVLVSNVNGDFLFANGFKYYTGPALTLGNINPSSGLMNVPINTPITAL
ncbi:MAG: IPT/TIG domain-containing protein, partial [Nitrospirota bacterium]